MQTIQLGFLMLSGERLAILAGVIVFMIGAGILASRISPRFNTWSTVVALGGLAAARLAHVATHWEYFQGSPLRALALWQGGFSWLWVLPVTALATLFLLKTRRERLWAIVPVAASALIWISVHQFTSGTPPTPPPALTLSAMTGPPVSLAAPTDRPTVINLWATWCAPCRREMPTLAKAERTHDDVRFLFINQGEDPAKVRAFLQREGLSLDHILFDTDMAVPRHYGTAGIPVTLFLHADGRLAKAHLGEIAAEQIASELKRLDKTLPAQSEPTP